MDLIESVPLIDWEQNAMLSSTPSVLTRLYEDIVIGAFAFGAKLGEEQLVSRYKAKRHVLREAFGQLEEFGLVEHVPNRGVFVREPHPSEVQELFEIRELLEIHAAQRTELPVAPTVLEAMRKVQDRHGAAARASQFREVLHLNTEFHGIQYTACGNDLLANAIAGYALRTHLIAANKFGDASTMERVIAQHEEIIAAMADNSQTRLENAIRAHFDMDRVAQYKQQYFIKHGDSTEAAETARPRLKIGALSVL